MQQISSDSTGQFIQVHLGIGSALPKKSGSLLGGNIWRMAGPEQKSTLIPALVFWEVGPPSLGTGVIFPLSECSSPSSSFPHPPSRGGGEENAGLCSLEQPLPSNSHFAKSRAVLTFSRFSLSLFSSSRISNIFCTLESVEN